MVKDRARPFDRVYDNGAVYKRLHKFRDLRERIVRRDMSGLSHLVSYRGDASENFTMGCDRAHTKGSE